MEGEYILLTASLSSQAELWDAQQLRNWARKWGLRGCAEDCCSEARAEAPTESGSTRCGIYIHEDVHLTGSGVSSLGSHETFTRPPMCERAEEVCPNQTQSQQGRNPRLRHRDRVRSTSRVALQASSRVSGLARGGGWGGLLS